ncbi:carboxypeptidase-like regulatory domain-containing protein [Lewinella sp. IMCC34183]|uniref:carboxypeptidase-like regulatory domain-containing protein n=1 Tax=Lewinella sp. IMCC34183 TaxID=2248762 RepID=UPI000E22E839|nr:carboxypeptidase-like regulatory domain-containing protein [Lewinella sp. IMCC34183]
MAYTPLRISVPEPCHADWHRMTPVGDNRRHCASCDKQVTDFSWMTDREIHQLVTSAGGNLCGRFRRDQLDRPIRAYVAPRTGWRAVAAGAGLLLGGGLAGQAAPGAPAVDSLPPAPALCLPVSPDIAPPASTARNLVGTVTDAEGVPLIGTTVRVAGTETGTVADLDGNFRISPSVGQRVVLSYLGYEPLEVPVLEQDAGEPETPKRYVLSPATNELESVTVVAGRVEYTLGRAIAVTYQTYSEEEEPVKATSGLSVYPSPFTDRLNVHFPAGDAPGVAATITPQLFAPDGRMLREWPPQTYVGGTVPIELALGSLRLAPGSYILRLTDRSGRVYSRVVLHR